MAPSTRRETAFKSFAPLVLLFALAGAGVAVYVLMFRDDSVHRNMLIGKTAGAILILFCGSLLYFLILRWLAGSWSGACDYFFQIFANPKSVSIPFVDIVQDENAKTGIIIKRVFDPFASRRGLHVVVDGREVGQLARCTERKVALAPGDHEICVQMDWWRSKPIVLNIKPGEFVPLNCGSRFRFLFPFYTAGLFLWPEQFFFVSARA